MNLAKEISGYGLRNGIPQKYMQFKNAKGDVIVNANKPRSGDIPLADEAAYNDEVQKIRDAQAIADAETEATALDNQNALQALRASGQANLVDGNPLSSDEAYVMMYQKLPQP